MDQPHKNSVLSDPSVVRKTSMGTLIMWNISKAVKTNPFLDVQTAIRVTQERLMSKGGDNRNALQNPEDQYLMCAVLAWQQLGHKDCDSLYQFIETKQKEEDELAEKLKEKEAYLSFGKNKQISPGSFISNMDPNCSNDYDSTYYDTIGPEVTLPFETKIVMRMESCKTDGQPKSKKESEKILMDKIDGACCMESACLEQLTKLDKETVELRTRAQRLARREAQRVELLERAEAAWKDLEMGYQRRLAAAEEKEYDMTKHIQKMIQERNDYKNECTSLAQLLKEKGDYFEKEQTRLAVLDKEVCSFACERLRLIEEAAQLEAELAELQCKSTQLDRDLQFKEEQVRGKLQNMKNEVDCARALTYEAERTIHAELSALRDQLAVVSKQLLEEDENNRLIKEKLEALRCEKKRIIEDLESCQALCDKDMQKSMDELNTKREQLKKLKEKVVECQCKLPVDEAVEVKRTPSLVALCKCDDKILEACSCSSLRTTLLTNLLSDLFGGLQTELNEYCSQMPCQLLKCLEDKHNWDKPSTIKNNLQKYFSKLLVGELDIAIATSIENYHARWTTKSCVDTMRQLTCCTVGSDGSADRVIEKKAQKLAAKLAEKLFQERADRLTAKAKEVLKTGPPPCECSERSGERTVAAVYPCLVKQPALGSALANANATSNGGGVVMPAHWRRTHQNISQLKAQLEDLKKASINKEDLKIMEENILKMVQGLVTEVTMDDSPKMKIETKYTKPTKKPNLSISRSANTDQAIKGKLSGIKRKQLDINNPKSVKNNILHGLDMDDYEKHSKKLYQSYAVNVCLCGNQREDTKKKLGSRKDNTHYDHYYESKKPRKGLVIHDLLESSSLAIPPSVNQTQPMVKHLNSESLQSKKKNSAARTNCQSDVACFHKPPSNTSIDNLFGTLANWKCDSIRKNDGNIICENLPNENNVQAIKEKATEEKGIEVPSGELDANKSNPHLPKKVVVTVSQGVELQNDLPDTTKSEYIGAINLEKSNDNICNCIMDQKARFSCLNSALCDIKRQNRNIDNNVYNKLPQNTTSVTERSPNIAFQNEDELKPSIEKDQTKITNLKEDDSDHVTKLSPLFPDDSEYCITFLGVTLKNKTSKKEFIGKNNECYRIHGTAQKSDNQTLEKAKKPLDKSLNKAKIVSDHSNGDDINAPQTQIETYDCNINFEDFKELLYNLLRKKCEHCHKNEDISPDSTNKSNFNKHSCVCCKNITEADETSELEVNAFHLLKEHLRNKLCEFKSTNCKSDCIAQSEEEKLFSIILQRVKQVISECTMNVACKCVNDRPSEGSWNRAYVLLQEYLKTKMKKVQCSCLSSDSKNIILPDVLDKVSNLIEDDFKRLKDLCKCKVVGKQIGRNLENSDRNLLPEKDTSVDNHVRNDKTTSNKSMLPQQIARSQETSNQEIIKNSTSRKLVGTNTSNQRNVNNSNEETETPRNIMVDSVNAAKLTNSTKQVAALDVTDYLDNSNIITKTPYIGYTIDCSCNGTLGNCSCPKSLLKNTEDITRIWMATTAKKNNFNKNHSYIMSAVGLKTNITDTVNRNETVKKVSHEKPFNDEAVSAHDSEDVTLKFSNDKLRKSIRPSTTTTIVSEDNASLETDEPIDWCDCSSTQTKSNKSNHVVDGSWSSSIYYPINNLSNRKKTVARDKYEPIAVPSSLSPNCECNMVPMCHVKMLVENIEKNLIQSKCTCDSLSPIVCPEHNQNN